MGLRIGIRNKLLNLPVLVKVMGIAVGMAALVGIGISWQIHHSYFFLEQREVEEDTSFIAKLLAAAASPMVRSGDSSGLVRLLDDAVTVTPVAATTIGHVEVLDRGGRLLARASRPPVVDPKARVVERSAALASDVGGRVSVALNDRHVDFEVGWHTRRILATTTFILLIGTAATWWLMRRVLQPLVELAQVARAVTTGSYGARATVRARDETGQLAATFNEMMDALQQKDALNHQLLHKSNIAAEEERKRVAGQLLGQTGQGLTCIIAGLAALKSDQNSADATKLNALRTLAAETLGEVHDISLALRPCALEDLGLAPALEKFCHDTARRHGVKVDCSAVGLEGGPRLPEEVELALFRIVQEAVSNAVRHGQAHSIDVLLQRKEKSVLAVIEDDGRGFEPSGWQQASLVNDRHGLLGIEERAKLLDGTLRIESRPGAGASLFVEIPLPKPSV